MTADICASNVRLSSTTIPRTFVDGEGDISTSPIFIENGQATFLLLDLINTRSVLVGLILRLLDVNHCCAALNVPSTLLTRSDI